jgi:thymidylate synthase (FAD)
VEKNMKVKLISFSQPSDEMMSEGLEDVQDLVAFCARVSNPSNQFNTETSEKLINYLIKNAHWSPLEVVNVCLEVTTTRDIARQILRHRSMSFQEFSQRYSDPTKDLSFVLREARLQDPKNRQNSIELENNLHGENIKEMWKDYQENVLLASSQAYEWAIKNGIAKEQARAVLPEGLTLSRMYVNGTLRSWIHFIQVRSGGGTQKEHMEIARECAKVISEIFPMAQQFVEQQ